MEWTPTIKNTLFHLVPTNSFAEATLTYAPNRPFVSYSADNRLGLEVGYHVASLPGGHVIAKIGRSTDLKLPISSEENPVSREHVAFEINVHTHVVVLSVRSKRQDSVQFQELVETNATRVAVRNAIGKNEAEPQKETIIGDGVLLYGITYLIRIALYDFDLVWVLPEKCKEDLKALVVHEYRKSCQRLASVAYEDLPTFHEKSEALTFYRTRSATAKNALIDETGQREELCQGGFGSVYKATDKVTGHLFAIKQIKISPETADYQRAMILREIRIMERLNHVGWPRFFLMPNIIEIIDKRNLDTLAPEIYMPLREGSLHDLVPRMQTSTEITTVCNVIMTQMLSALDYLECQKLIHRDIKAQNILFSDTGRNQMEQRFTFYLADFGLANYRSQAQTVCGTQCYMAPEIFLYPNTKQTCKVDIWGMFACMVAVRTRFKRFPPMTNSYVKTVMILRQTIKDYPQLEPMARLDPNRRASAAQMYLKYCGTEGLTTPISKIPEILPADPVQDEALLRALCREPLGAQRQAEREHDRNRPVGGLFTNLQLGGNLVQLPRLPARPPANWPPRANQIPKPGPAPALTEPAQHRYALRNRINRNRQLVNPFADLLPKAAQPVARNQQQQRQQQRAAAAPPQHGQLRRRPTADVQKRLADLVLTAAAAAVEEAA